MTIGKTIAMKLCKDLHDLGYDVPIEVIVTWKLRGRKHVETWVKNCKQLIVNPPPVFLKSYRRDLKKT